MDNNRLLKNVFLWDRGQHSTTNKSNFNAQVKQILIDCNMKTLYTNLHPVDIDRLKVIFREKDMLSWENSVKDKCKLDFLTQIKPTLSIEPFVKLNIGRYERSLLAQLRYGILQIQLETGRYNNEKRENRLCKICDRGVVEDQYHFVFHCPAYNDKRNVFTALMQTRIPEWGTMNDTQKFEILFKNHSRALGKFVRDLFLYRKNLIYK